METPVHRERHNDLNTLDRKLVAHRATHASSLRAFILSHYEVRPLPDVRERGVRETEMVVNLGKARVRVHLTDAGVLFPGNLFLSWADVGSILDHENVCYRLDTRGLHPLQVYSSLTGRVVSLYPTGTAPTITLSGIPMHRVKGTDPWRDTQAKIRAARPHGRVLDTCMGLGYTAVQAAARAEFVLTIELDPAVITLARQNPWSADLFSHPHIHIVQADVFDFIRSLPDGWFSVVIHDPPMFALAGELYGREFYREVYRVLRPRGRLFHYVGSPEKKMARNITRGVMQRLREVGFQVKEASRAFGVIGIRQ